MNGGGQQRPPPRRASSPGIPGLPLPAKPLPTQPDNPVPVKKDRTSDSRELLLQELKLVEERAREALRERDKRVEELEEEVTSLRRADLSAQQEAIAFQAETVAMISSRVTVEVQRQLAARAAIEGEVAGKLAGHEAGTSTAKRWGVANFIAMVVVAIGSLIMQKGCGHEDKPLSPAKQTSAPGPGYGGRL